MSFGAYLKTTKASYPSWISVSLVVLFLLTCLYHLTIFFTLLNSLNIVPVEKLLHTETELVKKLKEGDPFAFEVLFYKYRNKVKGFAVKIIPAQVDPEEIVQEVFV